MTRNQFHLICNNDNIQFMVSSIFYLREILYIKEIDYENMLIKLQHRSSPNPFKYFGQNGGTIDVRQYDPRILEEN